MNLNRGVKIYDNDWFLRHGLSAEQTADLLASWGIPYLIAHSKLLPMPNSAVTSMSAFHLTGKTISITRLAF